MQPLKPRRGNKEEVEEKFYQFKGLFGFFFTWRRSIVVNSVIAEMTQGMRPVGECPTDFKVTQYGVNEVVEFFPFSYLAELQLAGLFNNASASDQYIPGAFHDAFQIVQLFVESGGEDVGFRALQDAFRKLSFNHIVIIENDAALIGMKEISRQLVSRNFSFEQNRDRAEAVKEPDMGVNIFRHGDTGKILFWAQRHHAWLVTMAACRKNTDTGANGFPFGVAAGLNLLRFRCGMENLEICNGVAVRTSPILNFMEDHSGIV